MFKYVTQLFIALMLVGRVTVDDPWLVGNKAGVYGNQLKTKKVPEVSL